MNQREKAAHAVLKNVTDFEFDALIFLEHAGNLP
jgi:hypothetical protein